MRKWIDKVIYIAVIILCGYFGYTTKVVNVAEQKQIIQQFESNLQEPEKGDQPFSVSLRTIGVLYVPKIHLSIPIFDNAGEAAISSGSGLIKGTGTLQNQIENSVITSHNGDPSRDLFINVPKLSVGDRFYVKLKDGKTYQYEIIDTREVSPVGEHEQLLKPEFDSYVTLRTCTPIGINSHRFHATGKLLGEATQPEIKGFTLSIFDYGLMVIGSFSFLLLISSFYQDKKSNRADNPAVSKVGE